MTVAGQPQVTYSYDDADRLTGIAQGTATVSMTYDNASRRASLTLPNGIVVEYGYDDNSRLTSLTYKQGANTLGNLTYAYDVVARRSEMGGTWARTNLPAALTSATYDDANQVATFDLTAFTYDHNGNLTNDGARTYTWNARDELTGIAGVSSASFAYDGAGRRRAKTIGGTTTHFVHDGPNPVQELESGTPTANLLAGLSIDEYFTRADASDALSYLTDALGSSVALANGTGTIVTDYTYEPFGATGVSGASTGNAFRFTGREVCCAPIPASGRAARGSGSPAVSAGASGSSSTAAADPARGGRGLRHGGADRSRRSCCFGDMDAVENVERVACLLRDDLG
jgi:YD repeat-containing protein